VANNIALQQRFRFHQKYQHFKYVNGKNIDIMSGFSAGEGAEAEVELLLAAYGDAVRVVSLGERPSPLSGKAACCTVLVVSLGVLGTTVRLSIPHDYPDSRIDFSLDGDQLTAAERRTLQRRLLDWEAGEIDSGVDNEEGCDEAEDSDTPKSPGSHDSGAAGCLAAPVRYPGSLELCQRALDCARETEEARPGQGTASSDSLVLLPRSVVLVRVFIYFHHIVRYTDARMYVVMYHSMVAHPYWPSL
jgi:hypothetical protein